MSIQSEITRLETAKANLITEIKDKGETVPDDALLGDLPSIVANIGLDTTATATDCTEGKVFYNGEGYTTGTLKPYFLASATPLRTLTGTYTLPTGRYEGCFVNARVDGYMVFSNIASSTSPSTSVSASYLNDGNYIIHLVAWVNDTSITFTDANITYFNSSGTETTKAMTIHNNVCYFMSGIYQSNVTTPTQSGGLALTVSGSSFFKFEATLSSASQVYYMMDIVRRKDS